jgi:(S)-3,5-dihydroxyphenylglycine transaminase
VLLVSSPCYIGITGAARLLDIEVIPVPEGDAGPDPDAARRAARLAVAAGKRPRALYVVPDFANPSGASMTVDSRRALLDVAEAENFLLIEDNPYSFFTREIAARPTLKSMDTTGNVLYIGSFAKTCFPGARLGYLLADQPVIASDGRRSLLADEVGKVKSMITVNTPSLSQAVIGGMLVRCGCRLRAANSANAAFYRTNLQTLLAELERHFPAAQRAELGVSWNYPDGGFFTVLTVPFAVDQAALELSARDYGVLWTPMSDFYLGGGGMNQLRISSSYLASAEIPEGVSRLAAFIRTKTRELAVVR